MIFSKTHKLRKELKKLRQHANHTLLVDDDILNAEQKESLRKIAAAPVSCDLNSPDEMRKTLEDCDKSYRKILPPQKYAWIREYLDVLAVAVAVAFGIRGLFLQPFKIPTSSMQPTLFGIHYIAKNGQVNPLLEKLPAPLDYILFSCERAELKIKESGTFNGTSVYDIFQQRNRFLILPYTSFKIAGVKYSLPGEIAKVVDYTGINRDGGDFNFKAGQVLCDGWLSSGDHLFVDRFSHLLFGLKRGNIVVFNTEGIYYEGNALAKKGYYYIKRLAGLPGDTLKIINRQLYVCPKGESAFKLISDISPKFKKIYSGKGGYHGHWNVPSANDLSGKGFTVPPDSYFMLGDNSRNSLDSRYWGVVPRKNIVGQALFVFWPLSRRWGFTDRAEPIAKATDTDTLESMHLQ